MPLISFRSPARPAPPAGSPARVGSLPAPAVPVAARGLGVGIILLVVQLFLIFGRVPDFVGIWMGGPTYLVRVLAVVALMFTIFSGGLRRALPNRVGVMLTLFTLWVCVSTAGSIWKGGSVLVLVSWIKSYLYYVMTAGLILTIAHCQRALFAIGWGSVLIGIASLFFSSVSTGRLQFEVGTLGNPNYVALFLLLGVPAALLFTWNAKGVFGRVLGWIAVVILVSVALHTGSRMVLLVLLAALAMLFFRASPSRKLLLVGAALVFGLLAAVITPQRILVRYATLFTNMPAAYANEEFSQEVDSAVSSTISRRVLLERSLETTLHHPLLGVGPGMFSVYTGTDEEDPRGAWKETHNTYTQLSSEVGLPGFLFYLVALWYSLRTSFSTYRRLRREPDQTRTANTAYAVFLTLFLFAVAAPFASLAYDFFFPVFAGLAIGLEHATRQFQSAPSAPRAQAGLGVSRPLPRGRRER